MARYERHYTAQYGAGAALLLSARSFLRQCDGWRRATHREGLLLAVEVLDRLDGDGQVREVVSGRAHPLEVKGP